ncbi:OmpA family protein [Ureibacillus chungkukjangi]|uniref:Outer membrane protein OmpA-like peptidoglycan-associated protein n=1 Tax=Ureibacillus chungkukjangi TaxID=1202712 RepID=A0A318TLS9_9BACL|nr:OmpA family protein [Ureibacillus chungkukjangi]PYF05614.1 outer membrane protein OmpA-like peptidoglycan-associated protein [Ureibacillus chungkukjangi]
MEKKTGWLLLIVTTMFLLVGCESKEDTQTVEAENNDEQTSQVDKEQEVDSEEKADEQFPTDIQLGGEVVAENGKLVVKGTSNLMEGTIVGIDWLDRAFSIRNPVCLLCDKSTEVDENGDFTFEIPSDLTSFGHILVTIDVLLGGWGQPDEIEAVYGEDGENLEGPFVQKHEIIDEEYQKISASILVLPTIEQTVYPIETPKREKVPDDYGSAEVWIETELTNDHRYFYVKGKSNLLEGTELVASYFSSEEAAVAQNWISSSTNVVNDGTFLIQIPYNTITEAGYIVINSKPKSRHLLEMRMNEAYGETFEKMTGEPVIPNEEGGNMIEVILYPEPPIVEAPEDTSVTTDGEETKIQLPDDILFDHDQSDLKPDAQKTLDELIQNLETLKADTVMEINGHTDNAGDDQYNMELSEKRAKAVVAYLLQSGKVGHIKISTAGYGETMPIAQNNSEDGKAKNRRVEIVINPKE